MVPNSVFSVSWAPSAIAIPPIPALAKSVATGIPKYWPPTINKIPVPNTLINFEQIRINSALSPLALIFGEAMMVSEKRLIVAKMTTTAAISPTNIDPKVNTYKASLRIVR